MTTIKFSAGDVVFWLSSKGYKKGTIKSVYFSETLLDGRKDKKLTYRLTCPDFTKYYIGDEVPESLIFTSKEELLDYYAAKLV
jgi:hypothetical protein